MIKKIKYISYLAGAIESANANEMNSWREEVKRKLRSPNLCFYDPVEMESSKVGKKAIAQIEYIKKLKKAKRWIKFNNEMNKIWWGNLDIDKVKIEKMRVLIYLYEKSKIEGNYNIDMISWGDFEAVARSNFIIVYYPKDIKTVGTIEECLVAYLLGIPIYLILPDMNEQECNSTLINRVMESKGKIFYTIDSCCKYIKNKYLIEK